MSGEQHDERDHNPTEEGERTNQEQHEGQGQQGQGLQVSFCPLRVRALMPECLGRGCAWWVPGVEAEVGGGQCVLVALASAMERIVGATEELARIT